VHFSKDHLDTRERQESNTSIEIAQGNPNVMTTPAPSADFDFGADCLNFKLFAFVYDLNKGTSTSTDLRVAILDAFNEVGIAMPSRQTEATPPNMDWLREAVAEYVSSSHNGAGSGNGKANGITKRAAMPAA
jgi:small-conductance mechanosensitive channel